MGKKERKRGVCKRNLTVVGAKKQKRSCGCLVVGTNTSSVSEENKKGGV